MAMELAKKNRVLYVNPPLDRKTVLTDNSSEVALKKQVRMGRAPDLTPLQENLWLLEPKMMAESINWIPSTFLFKSLNYLNSKRYARCIASAIARLGFKDVILLNDSLMFRGYDLKELLSPACAVYYIRDYLVSQPYFKKHGAKMEPELMAKSDVVAANSVFLKNYAGQYNSNSYCIGQGYENTFFNASKNHTIPEELKPFKGKSIVGYVGTLTHLRLDESLLIQIAKALPDHQLVFVGPEDEVFQKSNLHQLGNVHFLGLKKMEELAAYVQHFDVCINPQLVNDLTIGNYPLKIDEYLSMGKPTVATHTEAMEAFSAHTYLAKDSAAFITLIQQAITENTTQKKEGRIAFASEHSWENCMKHLYQAINDFKGLR
jgi:teichuronic acid biosynthesis glycosyltransferase TuaH